MFKVCLFFQTHTDELQKLRVEGTSESVGKSSLEPLMSSEVSSVNTEKQKLIQRFSEATNVNLKWAGE